MEHILIHLLGLIVEKFSKKLYQEFFVGNSLEYMRRRKEFFDGLPLKNAGKDLTPNELKFWETFGGQTFKLAGIKKINVSDVQPPTSAEYYSSYNSYLNDFNFTEIPWLLRKEYFGDAKHLKEYLNLIIKFTENPADNKLMNIKTSIAILTKMKDDTEHQPKTFWEKIKQELHLWKSRRKRNKQMRLMHKIQKLSDIINNPNEKVKKEEAKRKKCWEKLNRLNNRQ